MSGGAGYDGLAGGAGADAFVFTATANGHDWIQGFRAGQGDHIVIQSGMQASITDLGGGDMQVTFTDAASGAVYGSVTLNGDISAADIVVDDLAFL